MWQDERMPKMLLKLLKLFAAPVSTEWEVVEGMLLKPVTLTDGTIYTPSRFIRDDVILMRRHSGTGWEYRFADEAETNDHLNGLAW